MHTHICTHMHTHIHTHTHTGVNLVGWNPDGFKIGLCDVPPADQSTALLSLANKYFFFKYFEDRAV